MTGSMENALLSLEGLSTGDAFGERFFTMSIPQGRRPELPAGRWEWTDDTHMALSIVETLRSHDRIEQDVLARNFARRFSEEPWRGYAGGAANLLVKVARGGDWRTIAPYLFGTGSYGNGAAMRAAPIGAYFSADRKRVAEEARSSAVVTHAHPEGQAGAIAVAVAAALATEHANPGGIEFIDEVAQHTPDGITRQRLLLAMEIPADDLFKAIMTLGTGNEVSAQDTVPFCIWVAAHHRQSYEEALWQTVRGRGDCDTTCAIVGGIVACAVGGVPEEWRQHRESLPLV